MPPEGTIDRGSFLNEGPGNAAFARVTGDCASVGSSWPAKQKREPQCALELPGPLRPRIVGVTGGPNRSDSGLGLIFDASRSADTGHAHAYRHITGVDGDRSAQAQMDQWAVGPNP
jgi:hypothetical protein